MSLKEKVYAQQTKDKDQSQKHLVALIAQVS